MALVLKSIYTGYKELFTNPHDGELTENYFVKTPLPFLTIVCSYLYFVKYFGPKLMQHRKPYQLKWIMSLYNVAQVAINLYIAAAVSNLAHLQTFLFTFSSTIYIRCGGF